FHLHVGIASARDEKKIGADFLTSLATVAIKRPVFGLSFALNRDLGKEYIARIGKSIRGDISFGNNNSANILNGKIEVKLDSPLIDKSSVSVSQGGFYRSVDNTIVWDKSSDPDLAVIGPGATGNVNFTFSTVQPTANFIAATRNPQFNISVTATGDKPIDSSSSASETVSYTTSRTIKLSSDLGLSTRIVYSNGPFTNNGAIPPKAEKETTYTVIWTATNGFNDVSGADVTATLPSYVKWLGVVSPQSEHVSFDSLGGKITWNIGELRAGTGISSEPREVAFQISFIPSVSQINSAPLLVNQATMQADDRFTRASLQVSRSELTTHLIGDSRFTHDEDKVIP
ncbi:hypothetical protein KW783_04170, partial [Candidatus Parcubacteria bacterium]|nr:hypothetical protein [Candidatus Parcubacteria bacterium]